jgi:hypothetical protein
LLRRPVGPSATQAAAFPKHLSSADQRDQTQKGHGAVVSHSQLGIKISDLAVVEQHNDLPRGDAADGRRDFGVGIQKPESAAARRVEPAFDFMRVRADKERRDAVVLRMVAFGLIVQTVNLGTDMACDDLAGGDTLTGKPKRKGLPVCLADDLFYDGRLNRYINSCLLSPVKQYLRICTPNQPA